MPNARKVKGMARVEGHTYFSQHLRSTINEIPKCNIVNIEEVNMGTRYTIQCPTEDVSEVLAHLLRLLRF